MLHHLKLKLLGLFDGHHWDVNAVGLVRLLHIYLLVVVVVLLTVGVFRASWEHFGSIRNLQLLKLVLF